MDGSYWKRDLFGVRKSVCVLVSLGFTITVALLGLFHEVVGSSLLLELYRKGQPLFNYVVNWIFSFKDNLIGKDDIYGKKININKSLC